jgi:hypothetical protein
VPDRYAPVSGRVTPRSGQGRRRTDKAGLQDPTVIELITETQDGEFVLVLSHDEPWTDADDELSRLRGKLNTYAAFALDEGLVSAYPSSADRPKRVRVDCVTPPTPRVAELLAAADAALRAYEMSLEVHQLP